LNLSNPLIVYVFIIELLDIVSIELNNYDFYRFSVARANIAKFLICGPGRINLVI